MKQLFCKAITPLFSTPSFVHHFEQSPKAYIDERGLYRPLECALFPGTPVFLVREDSIAQLEVPLYAEGVFFTDSRLLSEERAACLPFPTAEEVINRLVACNGMPYVWGGNDPDGMQEFSSLYQYNENFFHGVDCSGLLYYAYNGYLPRNTDQLTLFGNEVSLDEVQPLDICVWKGHVIIFLSATEVIESREKQGVVITSTAHRLREMYTMGLRENVPLSEGGFVIRRVFQAAFECIFQPSNVVI